MMRWFGFSVLKIGPETDTVNDHGIGFAEYREVSRDCQTSATSGDFGLLYSILLLAF
jgi:hypothetical protein